MDGPKYCTVVSWVGAFVAWVANRSVACRGKEFNRKRNAPLSCRVKVVIVGSPKVPVVGDNDFVQKHIHRCCGWSNKTFDFVNDYRLK